MIKLVFCLSWLCGAPIMAQMSDLVDADKALPKLYATGFEQPQGLAHDSVGNLYVANYRFEGAIGRITPDGAASVFCDLQEIATVEGRTPLPAGMKVDHYDRLIVIDSGAGRLLRISKDGKKVEVLAERCEGKRFSNLHDVALMQDGTIFFSERGEPEKKEPTGSVYLFNVTTGKTTRLVSDLDAPSGLAVTTDGNQLCVAEGNKQRIVIYEYSKKKAALTKERILFEFPSKNEGQVIGGNFSPQGLIFDKDGHLYVAMINGGLINVIDVKKGKLMRQYKAGGRQVTNAHFHRGYLYTTVANKEAVFRLKLDIDGFQYSGPQ